MPRPWSCTFCGKEANQHWCHEYTESKHIYFCNICISEHEGWSPLKNKKLIKWMKTRPKDKRGYR